MDITRQVKAHIRQHGIGTVQFAILEHLAQVAYDQACEARSAKRGFKGGWTYMRYTRRVRPESVAGLISKGLVQPCCDFHGPHDSLRITRAGIEVVEKVMGEEIMLP